MECVQLAGKIPFEAIEVPVLCVYTENDVTISIPAVKEIYRRFGSPEKTLVNIKEAKDHVLAGDIVSPETTGTLIDTVLEFLNKI